MSSVQRSIFFSAAERYASLVLFFLVTAVLSRMLSPKEFGIFAVISALTTVITASFQDFGGPNYLIQKQELSRDAIRTAFTITLGLSVAIGLVLFASAHLISHFFQQDSLSTGIAASALNFLLIPFSGTVSALFRRDMQFGKLAVCNLAANSMGAVASIILAMLNFSAMALILGNIATNALLTILLVAWHRDVGTFRPSLREYRDVLSFGLYSGGVSVINVFYNLAPQLFLARILDFASVGLYSRALSITQVFDKLVMQALNPVIMPAIVAQNKAGASLKNVYLEAVQLLAAVQWPFLAFIAVMARSIIAIWLGESWLDIVPLVRVLCIANMALFAACLSYPVLVASGRVQDALTSSLISLPPSLLVILCASFFGVQAVAASALLTLPFQASVAIYFIGRRLAITPRELANALLKSGAVTALSACGAAGCAALIDAGMLLPFVGLISACVAFLVCWWLGLALTGHPLLDHLSQAAASLAVNAPGLRPSRPLL
ncbi:lipopolysaccharide biosynthesis protein [Bradyrhizobium sp. STM 3562]|uniref:lipopolysaccharide biosynthesis protein n=1 Tax=Bradyrhizobium sp. STM 3562 TaxID=578924 RepID=UPI00388FA5F7